MSILDDFEKLEDTCTPLRLVDFEWTAKGVGFGQFWFFYDEKKKIIRCGNEMMSKDFIKQMLCKMVDDCVLEDE